MEWIGKRNFEQDNRSPQSQLGTIVLLFVILRLTILFFFSAEGPLYRYTDFDFYYRTAQLSEQGYYPFVNMWYEYPPVLAYLPQAMYVAAGWLNEPGSAAHYDAFRRLLSLVLLAFDTGSLLLVHRMGRRLWGIERANWLGWVTGGLSMPLLMLTYVHQGAAVFFLLLAAALFLNGRRHGSAAALGLAVAAKLLPVFLLGAAVRFLWHHKRHAVEYLVITAVVAGLAYLPFVLFGGGEWIAASFRALASGHSYATLWAIFDNNWGPGYYGPLETRLSLAAAAAAHGNPPVVPGIAVLLLFAALYAALFFRPIDRHGRAFVWFATLTMLLFHLWLKGWSPQYALAIFPFLLLSFPDGRGLAAVLVLSAVSTTHWTGSAAVMAALILARALLFLAVIGVLSRSLWGSAVPQMARTIPVTGRGQDEQMD